ncbi:unnamed protein product [Phytophthora fragariaefolia]|uniref:Unnamed protein product n=1 Tax=Phytophthora fragariaefolia TaxID=1490495 RepID=A0A9W6XGI9_9STRA|nr:unnamed protein product [Phytophthora fragariaefolia]
MDHDEEQPAGNDDQHQESPEMSSDDPVTSDEAEDPATPEENEKNVVVDDNGEPSLVSEMAIAEFLRASSEQLEGSEFSLLVVLQPDNVRHRVTVTAETTLGMLRKILCTDLQLSADLVSFPDLRGPRDADLKELELPLSAYGLPSGGGECTLEAYVARPQTTSDYVMPNRIQVQVYSGEFFKTYCPLVVLKLTMVF